MAPWASASLMVVEQSVSASFMAWAQVALASLMAALQMALASLIDLVVSDLFWQRSILSFQTNFCWWVLMDDLVASSSPRALLTFFQRWLVSLVEVLLLGPTVLGTGEGAVRIYSRVALCISASSGVLTWEDMSTGPERSSNLGGQRHEYNHGI